MADKREDLEKFLKDVDEIGSIIKDLSSQDEEKREEAIKASDKLLRKEEFQDSCTKINRNVSRNQTNAYKETKEQHQDQILRNIESDANERAARRKKNEAEAEAFKAKGNVAFKATRYEEAIECYTEAINLVKYFPAIYTNRAQAYINVGNYDAAIDDCKWAIRVDEKCVKAYVHCGRAMQRKGCFSEAISYFKNAEQINPKQKDAIKEYISQVENERNKFDREHKVVTKLENEDSQLEAVDRTIKALVEANEQLKECIILVENLKKLLENNQDCKTLFRVKNGFDSFNKHTSFKRLCEMSERWVSPEQGTFVDEMLNLAKIAVTDNVYNLEELLDRGTIKAVHELSKDCSVEKVKLSSVYLLHQISEFPLGRGRMLKYVDNERSFIDDLLNLVAKEDIISKVVMGCVNNLSLESRFCLQHSAQSEKVALSVIDKFVHSGTTGRPVSTTSLQLVSSSLSTFANLARIKDVRNRLQANKRIWELTCKVLDRYVDDVRRDEHVRGIIYAALGLLINILSEVSEFAKNYSAAIYPSLLKLLMSQERNLLQRTLGVLRLTMTYSSETVNLACNTEAYKLILESIKQKSDDLTVSYGVKCLTLCVINDDVAKRHVLENGLMVLYQLLKSDSEVTVGNCALILGSFFEEKEACERFIGKPIVKDLLTLASNERLSVDVKHNAAITLARLVKNDLRFLEQLRDLRGLEILHSVVKSTQS